MSTDEEDDSWLKSKIRFYQKVCGKFILTAKNPRRMFLKLKGSRLFKNFLLALLVSELFGLVVALGSVYGLISIAGSSKYAAAVGAIAISYYVLDAPFDFILWPLSCRALYPRTKWKSMYAVDISYFYLISKAVDWATLALQGVLATALLTYASFSGVLAVFVSLSVQIPLYMFIYTLLSIPLILAREEELAMLARRFGADRLLNWQFVLSLFGVKYLWRQKIALSIEICQWVRLYCIQPRAGPALQIMPHEVCGAFFIQNRERSISILNTPNSAIAENCVEL